MLSDKELKYTSKFLSWVLRHKPEAIGIQLDKNGWTDVDLLIKKSNEYGVKFNFAELQHLVETNAKRRFAFNENLNKIRASQGHSIGIELGYINQQPPEILFHGTSEGSVKSIFESGLLKRDRQHVHLSRDLETATQVGSRHGKPYVFKVFALRMHADGYQFYLSDNNVWLTDHVPSIYLANSSYPSSSVLR